MRYFCTKLVGLLGWCLLIIVSRLLPHPPNWNYFTSTYMLMQKKDASCLKNVTLWLVAQVVFDVWTGFSNISIPIYLVWMMIFFCVDYFLQARSKIGWISYLAIALVPSSIFFMMTNFFVWMFPSPYLKYPFSLEGLILCYQQALPFWWNHLLGDIVSIGVLLVCWSVHGRVLQALRTRCEIDAKRLSVKIILALACLWC